MLYLIIRSIKTNKHTYHLPIIKDKTQTPALLVLECIGAIMLITLTYWIIVLFLNQDHHYSNHLKIKSVVLRNKVLPKLQAQKWYRNNYRSVVS